MGFQNIPFTVTILYEVFVKSHDFVRVLKDMFQDASVSSLGEPCGIGRNTTRTEWVYYHIEVRTLSC